MQKIKKRTLSKQQWRLLKNRGFVYDRKTRSYKKTLSFTLTPSLVDDLLRSCGGEADLLEYVFRQRFPFKNMFL